MRFSAWSAEKRTQYIGKYHAAAGAFGQNAGHRVSRVTDKITIQLVGQPDVETNSRWHLRDNPIAHSELKVPYNPVSMKAGQAYSALLPKPWSAP